MKLREPLTMVEHRLGIDVPPPPPQYDEARARGLFKKHASGHPTRADARLKRFS